MTIFHVVQDVKYVQLINGILRYCIDPAAIRNKKQE